MFDAPVASAVMGRRTEQPKDSISLTLTAAYLAAMRDMAEEMEIEPSLSQLVDRAVHEFLEKRGKLPPAGESPKRKSSR